MSNKTGAIPGNEANEQAYKEHIDSIIKFAKDYFNFDLLPYQILYLKQILQKQHEQQHEQKESP